MVQAVSKFLYSILWRVSCYDSGVENRIKNILSERDTLGSVLKA